MPMWIELPVDEVAVRYEAGESIWTLGTAYGVDQKTIRHRLRAAGIKLRPPGARPGNKNGRRRGGPLCLLGAGYLCTADRDGARCYVHRGCWEAYHGPIPDDHVIHHRDGDRLNNAIGNLSYMTNGEHTALHHKERAR